MERTEVLIGKQIHRAGMSGGARCGASGNVRISYSGALVLITCPECRDETYKCTVHASSECAGKNGPTFDGKSHTPRIECAACYAVLSS